MRSPCLHFLKDLSFLDEILRDMAIDELFSIFQPLQIFDALANNVLFAFGLNQPHFLYELKHEFFNDSDDHHHIVEIYEKTHALPWVDVYTSQKENLLQLGGIFEGYLLTVEIGVYELTRIGEDQTATA
jgi:hypothetical protein